MKQARKASAFLFPLTFIICGALPSYAQTAPPQQASPLSQALSSVSATASQELSGATAQAVESGAHTLITKGKERVPRTEADVLSTLTGKSPQPAPEPGQDAADAPPPPDPEMPAARPAAEVRRTLYIEIAQRRLRFEAPLNMCFLDRTSMMQQGIDTMLSAAVEKNGDQVLLGVFMPCNAVLSPNDWQGGMPEAGFITWLNPSIGDTTPMSLPDYLDMREASFVQYAKTRDIGTAPDKAVHRNEKNVSLAFIDRVPTPDGAGQNNTSIIATTLLRQVPIEITLHLTGDPDAHKVAPGFSQTYATMDQFVAQLVKLNE